MGAVAGMIDASIYLGSALAGGLCGAIYDRFGWTPVFMTWIVCCAMCVLIMHMARDPSEAAA